MTATVELSGELQAAKRRVLRETFGFDSFRPGQEHVVDHVLAHRPVLAVMPTGAGKSLCYQLPALVFGGLSVVVSPLIALMDDQVAALNLSGIPAGAIHSGHSRTQNVDVWLQAARGELRLLYMSPERLLTDRMIAALQKLGVALVAIDEAHCISQWGHSFREDYLALGRLREDFPDAALVALTATADASTREDIAYRLFGGSADVFVSGFDRPNISISVADKSEANSQIERFVTARPGVSGIVYRISRKKVEETTERLVAAGVRALPYHAGMDTAARAKNQEIFLAEDGVVMVATVAFGMGIDKSDVRYVLHGDMPGSLEAYYQEIGRAGRDGHPAEALLLYGLEDVNTRRRFIDDASQDADRRRVEARRLDAMVGFCEAVTCRRAALLSYFGETVAPCGNCDTCRDPPEVVDGTEEAKTLIALVEATGERFGVAHLVAVLVGSPNEAVVARGHDKLPLFGSGAARKATEWRALVRQLVAAGVLVVDIGGYGGLMLTDRARAIAAGREKVVVRAPRKASRRRVEVARVPIGDVDAALLRRLKDLRRQIAAERGVPAYVIFPDRTLEEMAATRPTSFAELSEVRGVGQAKLDAFGEAFLEVLEA
ncbi:DNA helicase RecQ [Segnochrobactraceae bacterium EtOH-i3]